MECPDLASISNRFLCEVHFEQDQNSKVCRAKKSNGDTCKYKSSYKGFCGQHISVPKDPDFVEKEKEYETNRKIRIKFTTDQTTIIKQWFGVARKCYNEGNNKLRKRLVDTSNVRDIVTKELDRLDYVKNVPLKVKQGALEDLINAVSNAKAKFRKTKKFQKIHFRTRHKTSQSIYINKSALRVIGDRELYIYKTKLGKVSTTENIPEIPTHCRLVMKHNRFFYLCIPREIEYIVKSYDCDKVVALDPGERAFQTFYSPCLQGNIGEHTRPRLMKTFKESDKIKSKIDRLKKKVKKLTSKAKKNLKSKLKKLKKQYFSVISKPTRLIKELHSKTALFLCKNFQAILIPEYSSKQTAENLCSLVNRSNQALSHYSFRQRLMHAAKRWKRKIHIVPESYTTLTCTCCGYVNPKNSNEILACENCEVVLNRDIRGSRNIWIKNVIWFKNQDLTSGSGS